MDEFIICNIPSNDLDAEKAINHLKKLGGKTFGDIIKNVVKYNICLLCEDGGIRYSSMSHDYTDMISAYKSRYPEATVVDFRTLFFDINECWND